MDKFELFASVIESLKIPDNVIELKDGWCISTIFLKKLQFHQTIKISPFVLIKKIILAKSKKKKKEEVFDIITFSCRDIKEAFIPNYIKYITSRTFNDYENLISIKFSEDFKLHIINQNHFSRIKINEICIPKKIESIDSYSLAKKLFFFFFFFNCAEC